LIALVGLFTAFSEVFFWLLDAVVYLVDASKSLDLTGAAGLMAPVRAHTRGNDHKTAEILKDGNGAK
jgi:hypothetical protein